MNTQDNAQNNWKNLLENAEHFSGQTLPDKNEAWEKLYGRLHNRPRRKLPRRYWVAAAGLMAVAITALLFTTKEIDPNTSIIKERPPVNTTASPVLKESAPANETLLSIPKQQAKPVPPSPTAKKLTVTEIETDNPQSVILDSAKNLSGTAAVSNPHPDSPVITAVTLIPAKKKLKLVHVNEIGQPVVEPTANESAARPRFQSRFINNDAYNHTAVPVHNSFILLKSRNTSN